MIKLNVNLFKPSGKWAYGGAVEVSGALDFSTRYFRNEVMNNQDFVVPEAFADYYVVITHRDDYDTDPSQYFAQAMWPPGRFTRE